MTEDVNRPGGRAENPVIEAILSRHSMRAFTDRQVSREQVSRILEIAAKAPSGSNTQPWKVYVVDGEAKEALCAELLDAHRAGSDHEAEYQYYPAEWREPYLARRRANGWGLYSLLGIEKGQKQRMVEQHGRNYLFFDAPVGLIFTIDRDLELGSWFDYGMFLQTVMIAARGFGLHTCPQQAFARYHSIIQERLSIPDDEMVVCGMALGHADPSAPENALRTAREPVAGFTRFVDRLQR